MSKNYLAERKIYNKKASEILLYSKTGNHLVAGFIFNDLVNKGLSSLILANPTHSPIFDNFLEKNLIYDCARGGCLVSIAKKF